MALPVLIAAVDLGPHTARVLYNAAGFARVLDLRLKIVHVAADTSAAAHERLLAACLHLAPYELNLEAGDVVIRGGRVSEAIAREVRLERATLVVMGARGHGAVSSLLLGSTSKAVLQDAPAPVLLVPPTAMDIVSIGDRAALTCGSVIAAVDLTEPCGEQLRLASRLAHIASQPLLLMTVAKGPLTDHQAGVMLRQLAHGLEPRRPAAMIVRRGTVAQEIARCAEAEGAGLVVMGLHAGPRCRPGSIASAVMKTGKAFVLAVPGC